MHPHTKTLAMMLALLCLAVALFGCGGGGEDAGEHPFCDKTTADGKVCIEETK